MEGTGRMEGMEGKWKEEKGVGYSTAILHLIVFSS